MVFRLDEDYDTSKAAGWTIGHDNGGYDRALVLSDRRWSSDRNTPAFGSAVGKIYDSGILTPSYGVWHHAIATFRQGVDRGSFVALDGTISNKVQANNNDGKPDFKIGGDGDYGQNIKGLIKAVFIYETGFDEDTAKLAYRNMYENFELLPAPNA